MYAENRFIPLEMGAYQVNIFLLLLENIYCGYSLEALRRGACNGYLNYEFYGKISTFLLKLKQVALLMSTYNMSFLWKQQSVYFC